MRRLLILTLTTLLVCVAVCTASQIVIDRLLTRAHDMNTEIHMAMEEGDETAARDGLVALATYWDEYRGILEVLCDHEDLHNVGEHIIEARICMDYTDAEDFYTAVALIGEGIDHLMDQEKLTWSNLC